MKYTWTSASQMDKVRNLTPEQRSEYFSAWKEVQAKAQPSDQPCPDCKQPLKPPFTSCSMCGWRHG